jgi:hypothetical protein
MQCLIFGLTFKDDYDEQENERFKNAYRVDYPLWAYLICYRSSFASSDFGAFGSFGDFTLSSPLSSTSRPIDLTSLPPELVVVVKNIQKRDATTRAKAVQDLQARLAAGVDEQTVDTLLSIWVSPSRTRPNMRSLFIRL